RGAARRTPALPRAAAGQARQLVGGLHRLARRALRRAAPRAHHPGQRRASRDRARARQLRIRNLTPGDIMSTASIPYQHLGAALAPDYFHVREQFTDEQWERFIQTRRFVDDEVLPVINEYWEKAELPWPLLRRLPELGLVGEDIEGYGCPGMSPLALG